MAWFGRPFPTSTRPADVVVMENWLCQVTEPSTNAISETSMVVPLTHGVADAVSTGASPGRGHM